MTPRLLFVHDDPTTTESFQDLFENWGFEIIVEATRAAGIERVKTSQIDGILLDLDTLDMDGINMLTDLREQILIFPTIVMGSSGTEHLLITALTKGANDFLLKPVSIDEMYDKCLRLFG